MNAGFGSFNNSYEEIYRPSYFPDGSYYQYNYSNPPYQHQNYISQNYCTPPFNRRGFQSNHNQYSRRSRGRIRRNNTRYRTPAGITSRGRGRTKFIPQVSNCTPYEFSTERTVEIIELDLSDAETIQLEEGDDTASALDKSTSKNQVETDIKEHSNLTSDKSDSIMTKLSAISPMNIPAKNSRITSVTILGDVVREDTSDGTLNKQESSSKEMKLLDNCDMVKQTKNDERSRSYVTPNTNSGIIPSKEKEFLRKQECKGKHPSPLKDIPIIVENKQQPDSSKDINLSNKYDAARQIKNDERNGIHIISNTNDSNISSKEREFVRKHEYKGKQPTPLRNTPTIVGNKQQSDSSKEINPSTKYDAAGQIRNDERNGIHIISNTNDSNISSKEKEFLRKHEYKGKQPTPLRNTPTIVENKQQSDSSKEINPSTKYDAAGQIRNDERNGIHIISNTNDSNISSKEKEFLRKHEYKGKQPTPLRNTPTIVENKQQSDSSKEINPCTKYDAAGQIKNDERNRIHVISNTNSSNIFSKEKEFLRKHEYKGKQPTPLRNTPTIVENKQESDSSKEINPSTKYDAARQIKNDERNGLHVILNTNSSSISSKEKEFLRKHEYKGKQPTPLRNTPTTVENKQESDSSKEINPSTKYDAAGQIKNDERNRIRGTSNTNNSSISSKEKEFQRNQECIEMKPTTLKDNASVVKSKQKSDSNKEIYLSNKCETVKQIRNDERNRIDVTPNTNNTSTISKDKESLRKQECKEKQSTSLRDAPTMIKNKQQQSDSSKKNKCDAVKQIKNHERNRIHVSSSKNRNSISPKGKESLKLQEYKGKQSPSLRDTPTILKDKVYSRKVEHRVNQSVDKSSKKDHKGKQCTIVRNMPILDDCDIPSDTTLKRNLGSTCENRVITPCVPSKNVVAKIEKHAKKRLKDNTQPERKKSFSTELSNKSFNKKYKEHVEPKSKEKKLQDVSAEKKPYTEKSKKTGKSSKKRTCDELIKNDMTIASPKKSRPSLYAEKVTHHELLSPNDVESATNTKPVSESDDLSYWLLDDEEMNQLNEKLDSLKSFDNIRSSENLSDDIEVEEIMCKKDVQPEARVSRSKSVTHRRPRGQSCVPFNRCDSEPSNLIRSKSLEARDFLCYTPFRITRSISKNWLLTPDITDCNIKETFESKSKVAMIRKRRQTTDLSEIPMKKSSLFNEQTPYVKPSEIEFDYTPRYDDECVPIQSPEITPPVTIVYRDPNSIDPRKKSATKISYNGRELVKYTDYLKENTSMEQDHTKSKNNATKKITGRRKSSSAKNTDPDYVPPSGIVVTPRCNELPIRCSLDSAPDTNKSDETKKILAPSKPDDSKLDSGKRGKSENKHLEKNPAEVKLKHCNSFVSSISVESHVSIPLIIEKPETSAALPLIEPQAPLNTAEVITVNVDCWQQIKENRRIPSRKQLDIGSSSSNAVLGINSFEATVETLANYFVTIKTLKYLQTNYNTQFVDSLPSTIKSYEVNSGTAFFEMRIRFWVNKFRVLCQRLNLGVRTMEVFVPLLLNAVSKKFAVSNEMLLAILTILDWIVCIRCTSPASEKYFANLRHIVKKLMKDTAQLRTQIGNQSPRTTSNIASLPMQTAGHNGQSAHALPQQPLHNKQNHCKTSLAPSSHVSSSQVEQIRQQIIKYKQLLLKQNILLRSRSLEASRKTTAKTNQFKPTQTLQRRLSSDNSNREKRTVPSCTLPCCSQTIVQRRSSSNACATITIPRGLSIRGLPPPYPIAAAVANNPPIVMSVDYPGNDQLTPLDTEKDELHVAVAAPSESTNGIVADRGCDSNCNLGRTEGNEEFIDLENYFHPNNDSSSTDSQSKESVVPPNSIKGPNILRRISQCSEDLPPRSASIDSGLHSPSQVDGSIYENRTCLCGEPAVYVCPCKAIMYCSEACQLVDWDSHKSSFGHKVGLT